MIQKSAFQPVHTEHSNSVKSTDFKLCISTCKYGNVKQQNNTKIKFIKSGTYENVKKNCTDQTQ